MLTGTYVGATAQATAVAGVGANALVGGSNHSVITSAVSVQLQTQMGSLSNRALLVILAGGYAPLRACDRLLDARI
jgi:hypothetical protein